MKGVFQVGNKIKFKEVNSFSELVDIALEESDYEWKKTHPSKEPLESEQNTVEKERKS